jgi:hypothetical protein
VIVGIKAVGRIQETSNLKLQIPAALQGMCQLATNAAELQSASGVLLQC